MRTCNMLYEKSRGFIHMTYRIGWDYDVKCWGVINENNIFIFTTDTERHACEIVDCLNSDIKNW